MIICVAVWLERIMQPKPGFRLGVGLGFAIRAPLRIGSHPYVSTNCVRTIFQKIFVLAPDLERVYLSVLPLFAAKTIWIANMGQIRTHARAHSHQSK
jgi:hypothetical protein